MNLAVWATQNWPEIEFESRSRFNNKPAIELPIDTFFYLVEHVFMKIMIPDSAFSDYTQAELRGHFLALLHNETETSSDYPDFPENPRAMSKEDHLRIEMQAETNPKARERKKTEFVRYMRWKRDEIERRAKLVE